MSSGTLFRHALLIEDDSSHALLIKRALKEYVGEILTSNSLQDALLKLPEQNLDLVIADLNLPDSASGAHLEKIREVRPDLPMIVLTSSTAVRDAVTAMKLGARDYIVKNFEADFKDNLQLALNRVYAQVTIERERERLQKEMAVLRTAIENSNDGLAIIKSDAESINQLVYMNSAFQNFLGKCRGISASGDLINDICGECVKERQNLRASLEKNLKSLPTGAVWQTEVGFTEQKEVAFDLTLSVVLEESARSGITRQFLFAARDISEQKRRERFQREILSTTTHDLKGPLGAILISSELLSEMTKDQKKASDLALRINSSARGAVNLIDEFLSARRIQEGTFILRPVEHELSELVADSVDSYKTMAAARAIELTFNGSEGPVKGNIDKIGFARVLGNLLSNALKFTPKGGKVSVILSQSAEAFRVEVTDTGTGMEPSEVKKIFERFSRLDKHQEIAGTGLGLFVVKSIVTAHGGKIEVTSQPGQGTTFTLIFPKNPPVNERGELISLDFA